MAKKPKKKDDRPIEECFFCSASVVCPWTVRIGAMLYPMCGECPGEATKDEFSCWLRKDEDRPQ